MKHLKKIVSVLLTAVMMLAMCIPVMATEGTTTTTCTITAPATSHQYEIYQIFTGDLHEGTLSNIKWGINGTGTTGKAVSETVINELVALSSEQDDKAKREGIEKYVTLNNPIATITNGHSETVEAGYYLIKDKDGTVTGNDSYTRYIVKVVGNIEIQIKSDKPSFEKKLKDTNDTTGSTSEWQDSADYDIGDAIPFKLEGTVAADYADYKGKYYFAFHDVEETGLTFNPQSVKVYVGNSTEPLTNTYYEVKTGTSDGCTFEVVFKNLKNISGVGAGTKIRVEYTSTLNANATIGKHGNVNTAKLEFSNNPNEEQKGENKPSTGETPWDNVIVFTYKVVVNKYANSVGPNNKLAGAEFTLSKKMKDGTTKNIAVVKSTDGTSFTFNGLDDGDYVLTETKTPDKFNTISPITFTVTANHDIVWWTQDRDKVLTSLSGNDATGEITFTRNDAFELLTDVINKSGSQLPETGGIGTTIFYVVGVVLMLGAGVLLITKRRMSAKH